MTDNRDRSESGESAGSAELPPDLDWLPCDVDSYLDFFVRMDADGPPPQAQTLTVVSLLLGNLPGVVDNEFRKITRDHLKEMSLELGLGFAAIALALPSAAGVRHVLLSVGFLVLALALFARRVCRRLWSCLDAVVRAFDEQTRTQSGENALAPVRNARDAYCQLARDLPVYGFKLHVAYAVITTVVLKVMGCPLELHWPVLIVTIGLINCATWFTRFNTDDLREVHRAVSAGSMRTENIAQLEALREGPDSALEAVRKVVHLALPWKVLNVLDTRRLIHGIRLLVLVGILGVVAVGAPAGSASWAAGGFVAIGVIGYVLWCTPDALLRPIRRFLRSIR